MDEPQANSSHWDKERVQLLKDTLVSFVKKFIQSPQVENLQNNLIQSPKSTSSLVQTKDTDEAISKIQNIERGRQGIYRLQAKTKDQSPQEGLVSDQSIEHVTKVIDKLDLMSDLRSALSQLADALQTGQIEAPLNTSLAAFIRAGGSHLKQSFGENTEEDWTTAYDEGLKALDNELHPVINTLINESVKELKVRQQLHEIENTWKSLNFIIIHNTQIDCEVLGDTADIKEFIDETTQQLMYMTGSYFAKELIEQIARQQSAVENLDKMINQWLQAQRTWMRLSVAFKDINPFRKAQIQENVERLENISKFLNDLISTIKENPNCGKLLEDQQKIILNLSQLNTVLEQLDKIEKYLFVLFEELKQIFPRAYFVSNQALLDILFKPSVQAKNYLSDMFDGLAGIELEDDKFIKGFYSDKNNQGDYVVLANKIEITADCMDWMSKLETGMKQSLNLYIKEGLADLAQNQENLIEFVMETEKRKEYELDKSKPPPFHIYQVADICLMVMWVSNSEHAIQEQQNNPKSLSDWLEKNTNFVEEIVMQMTKDLPQSDRIKLIAIVAGYTRNRDIIMSLKTEGINSIHDFKWLKYMKHYQDVENDCVVVRSINASLPYGYEYIGNCGRLVLTPLTERFFTHFLSFYQQMYGSCGAGPAGTGKTETAKDLARTSGIQCVVFNCSDKMNYTSMAQILMGLCQAGSWGVLDEFNRILPQVLSVIASQINSIRNARLQDKTWFLFMDFEQINLKPSYNLIITMNPGYAGRAQLPMILKAQFRTFTMTVPDVMYIADNMLSSEGFVNSRELSKQMITTFKLCKEQMSKSSQYDFGLRSIKAILRQAGGAKRARPNASENLAIAIQLRNANLSRLLKEDVPIFESILAAVFPDIKIEREEKGALWLAIESIIEHKLLVKDDLLIEKIIQIFTIVQIRHSIMILGPTGSGKSTCLEILADALALLRKNGHEDQTFQKVEIYNLNPKEFTQDQLFGYHFQPNKYKDGILSHYMRESYRRESKEDYSWIVMNGPMDAEWVESLNTVMDDNKVLFLTSQERIPLSFRSTLFFEIDNLRFVTPATVSRAGIIYVPIELNSWRHIVQTFIQKLSTQQKGFSDNIRFLLQQKLDAPIQAGLRFLETNCEESQAFTDLQKVQQICNLFEVFVNDNTIWEHLLNSKDEIQSETLINCIAWCYAWGLGGQINETNQGKFDLVVRQNFKMTGIQQNKTIFDFWLDITSNQFKPWSDQIQQFSFDSDKSISSVIVPTEDTAKYGFFVENLTKIQKSLLFIGASGYGKTTVMTSKLKNLNEQFKTISMNLSIFSVAANFQKMLENNLMKKDEFTLGVELGKSLVVFVDNINMPQKDKYGTQSSSEFIKHLMDKQGLHIFDFDADKWHWKNVHEPTVVACYFGNPGGGINDIEPRIKRNFNTLRIPESSQQTMSKILSGLIGGFLQTGFSEEVYNLKDSVVKSTIELFAKMKSEFIPSPLKFYYIFDLRDVLKVVKGMCMANASSVPNSLSFVNLWVNESSRVFQDKLLSFEDKKHFKKLIMEFVKENFQVQTNMEDLNNLRFGDMMNNENRYEQIPNLNELLAKLYENLEEHNKAQSQKMNLVLFEDAVDHILTISRILRQHNGHLIFVGLAGSGRQSLIRLSSYTRGIAFGKLGPSNSTGIETFNESIKVLMKSAGLQGESISFVLMDTQITEQKMLVILTELMNTAEVPGLLNKNDQDEIRNGLQSIQIEKKTTGTSMNYYEVFKDRIQKNLHICVCFSPVGDTFRQTGRDLPQLLSQCSIDWFLPWPDQALIQISQQSLKELPQLSREMIERVSQVSQQILASSNEASKQFLKRHKRFVYFTPKSYLDFLSLYKEMLTSKSIEIEREKTDLEKGVATLDACKEHISSLKSEQDLLLKDIESKNQKQQEAQKQTGLKCVEMCKQIRRANEQTQQCQIEKKNLEKVFKEKQDLLKQAMDEMENAGRAIKQLDKDAILEILSYGQPPAGVRVVMECIMVILDEPKDWANIKKNLMDVKGFYHRLKKFDASYTPEEEQLKIQGLKTPSDRIWARAIDGYISKPNFDPSIFRKISVAAYALSKWAISCSELRKILVMVYEQKKENQIVIDQLSSQIKQNELANQLVDIQCKDLGVLGQNLDQLLKDKNKTMEQFDEANKKLQKAQNLIDLLQDEGIRWVENCQEIQTKIDRLTGNILLSSACLIYFGPFFDEYRESLLQQWNKACLEKLIPVEQEYNLVEYLGDPPTINQWAVQGLPTDMDSIEDGILTMKAARYPLCIDPQKQALKWIEQMHKQDIVSIKVNQAKWKNTIQMAISQGKALLVEDIEQDIDQYFNPLLDIRSRRNFQESTTIQIGDSKVELNPNFRLYMFTRMSNPHFNPEIQMKMTMVNFEVSLQGIQQQLLSDVVTIEKPEIEQQRDSLIKQTVEDKEKLTQLEEKVLKLLSESDGSILEDTQVLETLEQSKKTAKEIQERIQESNKFEAQINKTRSQYNSLAEVAGGIYFVVVDLEQINFQYKFSFEFLKAVFKASITESPQADQVIQRVSNIEFTFVKNIYSSICRGLFERDKLTFSFKILVKIQFVKKIIEPDVWNIFLRGPPVLSATEAKPFNPDPNYFTQQMWDTIYSLEVKSSNKFKGITEHIKDNLDDWKSWFKSENPQLMPLPASQFQQQDNVLNYTEAIQKQVDDKMIEVKKIKEQIEILIKLVEETKAKADELQAKGQVILSKLDNKPEKVRNIFPQNATQQMLNELYKGIERLDSGWLEAECNFYVTQLIPFMERCTDAVNFFEKRAIQEFIDLKYPPPACVDVAKVLLILLKGEKQNFSWENAQKIFSDPVQFIEDCQAFDGDNIDEWKLEMLKPITAKGLFFKEYLMDISQTAGYLCEWVNEIVKYNRLSNQVKPFKVLYEMTEASQKLDKEKSELKLRTEISQNLQSCNEVVAKSKQDLAEAKAAQQQVENEVQLLKNQLTLADRLNNGQADENERWRWKQNVLNIMDQRTIKSFDKLVLVNSVRPEQLKQSILSCLAQELGQFFCKPPSITSKYVWAALSKNNPLLIYELPESNPNYLQVIDQLAAYKSFDLQKCCHYVTLGQGMDTIALQRIQQSMDEGHWVVLSQCQTMLMFMKNVAMILGDKQRMDAAHEQFRLFIVTEPITEQSNEQLPISLIYGCVQMVTEPAIGIKASLKRYWNSFDKAKIDASNKTLRKLLFSLCYLHAIFWERNKFGPIGWNKSYTFTISDLIVTEKMLEQTIERKERIDKDSFDFSAEIIKINYGGQISDPLDLRLMETLANQICGFESLQDGFKYSQSGTYYNPPDGSAQSYNDYIETLPDIDAPELFYMHENVNIILNKTISDRILQSFLGPENQGNSVGQSDDKSSLLKCQDILGKLPQKLDQSKADKRLFTQDENGAIPALSMYLLQEIQRYNTCWKPVRSSLINLEKAQKGQILMSAELESIQSQILNNQVPHQWKKISFPTVFGLSRWIENFKERIQFMQKWIDEGNPKSFWISGFFLPEAFEVAVLQTEARNLKIPIDKLSLSFTIMPIENQKDVTETPKTGVYVHGLYIDGARWDREQNFIADQFHQKIIETMPLIHFKAQENYKRNPDEFAAPVFKTTQRLAMPPGAVQLVFYEVTIPSKEPPSFWILRNVALLCMAE